MKPAKLLPIFLGILIILIALPTVIAEEDNLTTDPGITPDSPIWGIDKALEQIGLLLIRSPEAKAARGLEIAHERLLEVKVMIEENKLGAVARAERAHNKTLLRVRQNIQNIEDEDAEVEIDKELEFEARLKRHTENVRNVRAELRIKIKIQGELSEEQQLLLDEFLQSFENNANGVEIEIENKKNKTKIRIRQKTGESELEIERKIGRLEIERGITKEKLKVKVEIVGNKSFVKVERNFKTRTIDEELLIDEIIEKFSLDSEMVGSLLKIGTDEENETEEDRLRIRVKIRDDLSDVKIKLMFSLDSIDRETIVNAIVERTQLTKEGIEDIWMLKVKEKDDEKEIEIEVEIEDGKAEVEVRVNGVKTEFVLEITDQEEILREIASRLGVSVEDIREFVEFEVEDEEETEEDETEENGDTNTTTITNEQREDNSGRGNSSGENRSGSNSGSG